MKNIKLLFLLFILIFNIDTNAQCIQNAFDFGNNVSTPMYNVSGDVSVTLNQDNTVTLDLGSNFTTAPGPDVRAYFINQGTISDSELQTALITNIENIKFGLVSSNTVNQNGAKTFTVPIPAGRNISNYTKVLFYCLNFNRLWDYGAVKPFTNNNCNVLSTNKTTAQSFSIYPNPAINKINIANNSQSEISSIKIYNILGNLVFNKNKNFDNTIDISSFSDGVYLVEILDTQNKKFIKRLVKSN